MNSKKCTKCGNEKPLTEFYKRTSSRDGLCFICKTCASKYRAQNRENILKKQAEYRAENKEKLAKRSAEYRAENRENILKKRAKYRAENRENILKKQAEYRAENRENILKKRAEYRKNNPEKMNEYKRKWRKKKLIQDPEFFKKQLSQAVAAQISCIYRIKNLINGKVYVGETISKKRRWIVHKSRLRGGYHRNHYLQEEYDKYGEEVFTFEILEELENDTSKDEMLDRESYHIQRLLSEGVELYNHKKPDRGKEQ